MKWEFFYDENEDPHYQSFSDWERQTHHLHWTLILVLFLIVCGFLFFSIFSIS